MRNYETFRSQLASGYADLGWTDVSDAYVVTLTDTGCCKLPMVYSPNYNISLWGLENFHRFDAKKFVQIVRILQDQLKIDQKQLWSAVEATEQQLCDVHTEDYIRSLHSSSRAVAEVVELPQAAWLPNWLVQNRITKSWRFHAGGTILAAALSLQYGWSINIGGGMHHASFDSGSGWCAYDDIYLAIRKLRQATAGVINKCLLIDLDVHQGNGHERDKLRFEDEDLFIVDIYGHALWPGDGVAKAAINVDVGIDLGTGDLEYMGKVEAALQRAEAEFSPDFIIYNAGSDILVGDPLGQMAVTAEGVQQRDQCVWTFAQRMQAPICMLLSGGYAKDNARVVGDSLATLLTTFHLLTDFKKPNHLWLS